MYGRRGEGRSGGWGSIILALIELIVGMILTTAVVYLLSIVFSVTAVPPGSLFYGAQQSAIWGTIIILGVLDVGDLIMFIITISGGNHGGGNRRQYF